MNKGSLQKKMFKNFKNVMAGTETAISMLEEKENEGKNFKGDPMVREFLPRYMASLHGQP